jgi:hypothetical protein
LSANTLPTWFIIILQIGRNLICNIWKDDQVFLLLERWKEMLAKGLEYRSRGFHLSGLYYANPPVPMVCSHY